MSDNCNHIASTSDTLVHIEDVKRQENSFTKIDHNKKSILRVQQSLRSACDRVENLLVTK